MATGFNSTITIYGSCEFDTQHNCVYYGDYETYLSGKSSATYGSNAYIDPYKGQCDIFATMGNFLSSASYGIIQNSNYDGRKFCVFIDHCEYVNDNVTRVYYSIDTWGTFNQNISFAPCYVERHHASDDTLFSNLVPEPSICTSSIINSVDNVEIGVNYCLKTYCNPVTKATSALFYSDGRVTFGYQQEYSTSEGLWNAIYELYTDGGMWSVLNVEYTPKVNTVDKTISMPTSIDGYVPRNNKCFTGQFNKLVVDNNCGNSIDLFFELSSQSDHGIRFMGRSEKTGNPKFALYPVSYRGVTYDYQNTLIYSQFPTIPYPSNEMAEYMNRNSASFWTNVATTGVTGITDALTLNVGGVAKDVGSLVTTSAQLSDMSNHVKFSGQIHSDMNIAMRRVGYSFYVVQAQRKVIRQQDEFFERYGYAQNKIMTPNPNARPYYTYIKTSGCSVGGNIPMNARNEINAILDKGVTIWVAGRVGNYNYNNSV